MNKPLITKIINSQLEAENIKTISFQCPGTINPGQYFMVWIPGVDEIPMSVSNFSKNIREITFRKVGEATHVLYNLKPGDKIGIRGPYGTGFKIIGKNILFVGGGTGIATLAPAIQNALHKNIQTTAIFGYKTKCEAFFTNRFKEKCRKIVITTDDGSLGKKGLASDIASYTLKENDIDSVITCGPERMMKTLFDRCDNISFQASLERYIKCSIGLCGQCCIGPGLRVCIDGPVFDGKTLKNVKDFGIFRRDAAGRKLQF
jgi:dihydroorotate dehydrogenase electron transfer subunit